MAGPISTPMHNPDEHGQFCRLRAVEASGLVAVVATLSKGYDLDYIWRQVDRGPAKDAAGYYLQASESGGEPPGRWWGSGARALGLEPGQVVERGAYDLLFGQRKAADGTALGRPSANVGKAVDIYQGWPPSRTPPPTASTNSGSKRPNRPARAPCIST